ncbi:30S ribosomal protein S10 [Candidatus Dependentiae bacterium]|nr:30S ribosomal protein S10 [Candidatus Dependentiae bacterium]
MENLRIKLKSYDHRILDKSVLRIVNVTKKTGAKIAGPIPLPTKISRYTVLRSPHVDKKSREQFEIRIHQRLIEIIDPTEKTMEAFNRLNLPAGVNIEIKTVVQQIV